MLADTDEVLPEHEFKVTFHLNPEFEYRSLTLIVTPKPSFWNFWNRKFKVEYLLEGESKLKEE
jgi:hypothetical protein